MQYLGIEARRLRVGVFDFTGCEGCQLQLLAKEETLGSFFDAVEVVEFREASSAPGGGRLDVAIIDGSISRDDQIPRLEAIRARADKVVALGTCACFGGVNKARNAISPADANRLVYGGLAKATAPVRPVSDVVAVDVAIPGCPVAKEEVERAARHLVLGLDPPLEQNPVCLECKQRFVTCVYETGGFCLGPVTRGGCGAPCPRGGIGCWGCRGPAAAANFREMADIARRYGWTEQDIRERARFFGTFDGVFPATEEAGHAHRD